MTKEEFKNIEKLYHYTSFESAVKIIESGVLKFSPLQRMNDINEKYRQIYLQSKITKDDEFHNVYDDCEKMLSNFKQISFTCDNDKRLGFDISAMWGHYGRRGEGVCLLFDKGLIIEEANKNRYEYATIKYISEPNNEYHFDKVYNDEIEFYTKNKEIFITKTDDWSYEQEFRILNFIDNKDFNIKNALAGIILYNTEASYRSLAMTTKYKMLKSIAYIDSNQIPIIEYHNSESCSFEGHELLKNYL